MKQLRYNAIAEMNMTSMVDVISIILIMYMIAAPAMQSGLEIQLPKAHAREVDVESGIVITLTAEGKVFLGELEIQPSMIEDALTRIRQAGRERPVFIRADQNLAYGRVLDVISHVKTAGVYNVGLVTEAG
ncbi:biopolymer transporter ExbD [Candidatus Fermentibacteria bacterium]|nr:biopolymer transporter ExbD [Candidatus Fermentibacteria bacterium]